MSRCIHRLCSSEDPLWISNIKGMKLVFGSSQESPRRSASSVSSSCSGSLRPTGVRAGEERLPLVFMNRFSLRTTDVFLTNDVRKLVKRSELCLSVKAVTWTPLNKWTLIPKHRVIVVNKTDARKNQQPQRSFCSRGSVTRRARPPEEEGLQNVEMWMEMEKRNKNWRLNEAAWVKALSSQAECWRQNR